MQCFYPFILTNESNPMGLVLPCGKCIGCRVARTKEWAMRLLHEFQYWDKASYVTFTYSNEFIPVDSSINKKHLQLLFKRVRKNTKRLIKYYACGEYGEKKMRPHYHAIVYGISPAEKNLLKECWHYGTIYSGTVTYESCRYVAQYIDKKYNLKTLKDGLTIPFQIQSNGFGLKWANDNALQLHQQKHTTIQGVKQSIPRYYKNKLGINTDSLKLIAWLKNGELYKQVIKDKKIKHQTYIQKKLAYHESIKKAQQQNEVTLKAKLLIREAQKKL